MSFRAYAAPAAGKELEPIQLERPSELGPFDVEILVECCGICHSDIHLIDNDWRISSYPLIPGHEVVGKIVRKGALVQNVKEGDRVGVGWQCASCLACEWCERGEEPACDHHVATCVGRPGGYAEYLLADSRFAFPIPEALPSESAAPLLCGGITVFTPLSRFASPSDRVGVIGIGGLGHLALQFARAMGCEVTAFSTSPSKEAEAKRLGAHHFVVSTDEKAMKALANSFDLILSTVTADLNWPMWLSLVRKHGRLQLVGASPGNISVPVMQLVGGQKTISGTIIGGRAGIRKMLAFAARHGVRAQAEVLPLDRVNEAVARVRANQARYRMVLKVQ